MKKISIYIHWPFCISKCPYCDFNSHVQQKIEPQKWLKAFLNEIDFFSNILEKSEISSIFFGGGTPSLMPPEIASGILNHLKPFSAGKNFQNTEITFEANPGAAEVENFENFRKAGINRISIGIQSFNDENLKFLGRKHNAEEGIRAIKTASSIFDRFSFDLIYSLPGQNFSSFQKDLNTAMELAKDHISLYQLTIEKGTEFFSLYKKNHFQMPSDEESFEIYEKTTNFLKNHNFHPYEISNYAKPGAECKHNLQYWQYGNYLGIGPGAHGRIDGRATMTIHSPAKWLEAALTNSNGMQSDEILTKEQILQEILIMNLRIESGISNEICQKFFNKNFSEIWPDEKLKFLITENLLTTTKSQISATPKGRLLLGQLTQTLANIALI